MTTDDITGLSIEWGQCTNYNISMIVDAVGSIGSPDQAFGLNISCVSAD